MGQLELLAAPFAFSTWADRLMNRSVLLWIDNDAAAASLVKGYSLKGDNAEIVGEFWILVASLRSHVYIDRVESKNNIADGPSRDDYELLHSLKGHWTSPKLGTFGRPATPPCPGLANLATGGEKIHSPISSSTGGEIMSRVDSLRRSKVIVSVSCAGRGAR